MIPEISDAFDDIMYELGAARDHAEKMRYYTVMTRIDKALDRLEFLRNKMEEKKT